MPWVDDLMTRQYLLGDWGGFRTKLREFGITFSLTFVSDVQGNPVGGARHGFREFDNLGLDVSVDLATLAGLDGAQFHVSASSRSGSSPSREDIRNVFNVAQVCCGASYRLVDVYYEQSLVDDRLNVRLGRLATGDEFLASPLYGTFVQNALFGSVAPPSRRESANAERQHYATDWAPIVQGLTGGTRLASRKGSGAM
jgi:porin